MPNKASENPLIDDSNSIADLLSNARERFKNISHSPVFDADLLLAHVLGCDRSALKAWPGRVISDVHRAQFDQYVTERATGKPIAYILGKKGFWTFDVDVSEHTLVPRPETELLVEQAIKLLPDKSDLKIADICTGSGAIAFAIAIERPDIKVHASDIDTEALHIANGTHTRLKLPNVFFYTGDLYLALPDNNYELIVSNPPYIDKNDPYLQHPSMQHEPRHALIAENNGLAIIERLIADVRKYLVKGGHLLLEHGHEQAADIRLLAKTHGLQYQMCLQDFQALDRVSVLQYD